MAETRYCKKCNHEMLDTVCVSHICNCVCDPYGER